MDLQVNDIPPLLIILCFGILMLGILQLVRIQIDTIADLRRVTRREAKQINKDEYSDGEGVDFQWRAMREYCERSGQPGRFTLWCLVIAGAVAGGFASVFLDRALR